MHAIMAKMVEQARPATPAQRQQALEKIARIFEEHIGCHSFVFVGHLIPLVDLRVAGEQIAAMDAEASSSMPRQIPETLDAY